MNRYVWVCDHCLMACCWAGIFMCEKARTAGLICLKRSEAVKLRREHTDYLDRIEVGGSIEGYIKTEDARKRALAGAA